jgi:hypothetical protein
MDQLYTDNGIIVEEITEIEKYSMQAKDTE